MATFTITLTTKQIKCLNDSISDIQGWLQESIDGKINHCKKRMVKEWQPKLYKDGSVTTLPATEAKLLDYILARADYKNRATKDAE